MEIIQKISLENDASKDYLEQLIEIAEQYKPLKTANPKDFINYVEQTDIATPETGTGIILSTIHGSKGLGFDIVILPELSGMPNHPDIYTKKRNINILGDELEIERVTTLANKDFIHAIPELKIIREQYQKEFENEMLNLLYVALTRAKKGLYLLTGNRKITKDNKINKFLDVLIPALFEKTKWLSNGSTKENLYSDYLKLSRQLARGFDNNFYEMAVNEFFEILQKKQIKNILTKPEEKSEIKIINGTKYNER